MAVDQIDTLVAQTRKRMPSTGPTDGDLLLDHVADGLMTLREVTRRTITVVTCLPQSWTRIEQRAVVTVADRFRSSTQLQAIPSPEVGRDLVAKRLQAHYRSVPFEPPYPTWPIRPEAFDEAVDYTPRDLLIRVERHVDWCRTHRQVRELERLDEELPEGPGDAPASRDEPHDHTRLARLDERFAELRAQADITRPFGPAHEDPVMPTLLMAALVAWKAELGETGNQFEVDAPTTVTPDLHARLRLTVDAQTEDEDHWSFRSVASVHGTAQFNRVKAARKAAGVHPEALGRTLILIRNVKWTTGPATNRELATIRSVGGGDRHLGSEDVRTFSALATMLTDGDPDLDAWLRERRPASGTEFLESVLGKVYGSVIGDTGATDRQEPDERQAVGRGPVPDVPETLMLGLADQTREPVRVPLLGLRKHMAIFAGSGSGKTVLIRRLVEQCALQGVSAIVLDPNNDLARLGDAWPEPPSHWIPGDAARAMAYLDGTDVVVWTPGRQSGRPLSFQPLPNFAEVLDDRDEFEAAVDTAVATLAPHGGASGTAEKAKIRQAVLRQAVRSFGNDGGGSMQAFVGVLKDLPDGVSTMDNARTHAAQVGTLLEAAMENDPVFGGSGQSADPGMLLTPPPGKRARVSVINFVGLPSDEQRQAFVNQLQMALFAWAKRHPAGDRPLGGLLVMDEAQTLAPSGELTACTKTTLMLASQARKYGLGLVFATQAPKALHNRIPGNATTQLFGYLNAPAQIEAAKEMARAKGSRTLDISRLGTAEFYAAREGAPFQKVRVPMCLSHHPPSPLTVEEVIERARSAGA